MKIIKKFNQTIKLVESHKVFEPNLTTMSIIEACNNLSLKKKKKILDLGSGTGIIGVFLKKKFKKKVDIYFSDYSENAIKVINSNIKINKINGTVKKSNILENWKNEKFDIIINDISAISSEIAKKHWYNEFIPHDCGEDGIKLSKIFLSSAKDFLNKNGIILMPVISISNHKKIIKIFNKKFKSKLLITKEWPAPKGLSKLKVKKFLKKKYIYKKFDLNLCFTKIYKLQILND